MPVTVDTPQVIDLMYDGKRHWFNVQRYTTPKELYTAMLNDGIRVDNETTVAHVATYPNGEESGRMYLLDTTVATYAGAAVKMAFNIALRGGTAHPDGMSDDIAAIAGQITSELYKGQRY